MNRVGVISALPGELEPLVRGWKQRGQLWLGHIHETECIAIAGGMGADAAARACELVLNEGDLERPLDTLVSYGWAGALTCGLKPPQAHVISEVIDARTGEHFATASLEGQRLLTAERVVRPNEKRGLAERFQTPLVDMEAAAVARIARQQAIAFYCFKGISDGYTDKLPDFNPFIGKNGQMRMTAFVAYAIAHPQYWSALKRLGKNSKAAAQNLAALATESLTQSR
jgi:adenosylhomocysteine nucleosidase